MLTSSFWEKALVKVCLGFISEFFTNWSDGGPTNASVRLLLSSLQMSQRPVFFLQVCKWFFRNLMLMHSGRRQLGSEHPGGWMSLAKSLPCWLLIIVSWLSCCSGVSDVNIYKYPKKKSVQEKSTVFRTFAKTSGGSRSKPRSFTSRWPMTCKERQKLPKKVGSLRALFTRRQGWASSVECLKRMLQGK